MKKNHFIIFLLLAFFVMPSVAFACGNSKSEMTCCSKSSSSKREMKDCCEKAAHSKSKKQSGCNGKCGHNMCSNTSVNIAINTAVTFEIQNNNFNFSIEKQNFHSSEALPSDGYSSIWLIPKIS